MQPLISQVKQALVISYGYQKIDVEDMGTIFQWPKEWLNILFRTLARFDSWN
jgi:hypothetical protein